MQTRTWLYTGWLVAAAALTAAAQVPPAPVVPPPPTVPPPPVVPTVPPPPVVPQPTAAEPTAVPTPAPQPTPAEPAGEAPAGPAGSVFTFTLRGEEKCIAPFASGDAKTEEGKIEVTPEDNTWSVTMTGGVGANVWLGCHSEALQTFHLIEEVEVTCSDSSVKEMILTLDSKLIGFVRSKHKASACVRLASLTVSPAGSSTPILAVSHPLPCVGGASRYCDPAMAAQSTDPMAAITSQPLPLGVYVIDAHFVLTATADGFLDAHSTAIFTADAAELDPWEREHDPFAGDKHDGFGFTSVLTASKVNGPAVASEKTWQAIRRRELREKRERQLAKQQDPRYAKTVTR